MLARKLPAVVRVRVAQGSFAAALGLAVVASPGVAVTGPGEVSFRPVRPGHTSRVSIPFTVAPGEQVPAAILEGSGAFRIESDACAGNPRAGTCRVRVRFAPKTIGPQQGTLRLAQAAVGLVASAYGIGPSLEASPGGFSWVHRPFGSLGDPIDSVRRVRLVNRGDAAVTIMRLAIRGRDRGHFTITAQSCSGHLLAPGAACHISVRLRSPGGRRRARLQLFTEVPREPFTLRMGNDFFVAERKGEVVHARPVGGGQTWTLGVVDARFAGGGVVTDIYTNLSAQVSVHIFRGKRQLRSWNSSHRLIGQQTVVVPGALNRGTYYLAVNGRRVGERRDAWRKLHVR